MSGALTIAAVTMAFGRTINLALNSVTNLSAAPEVRFGRPSSDPNFVGAALFLYRTSPNGARRNDDLATRNRDGVLLRKPGIALDLQYLVSFHGEEATLEAQRMMGAVVCAVQAEPFVSQDQINAAVLGSGATGPLAGADYAADAEPVRLSLTSLDPEMMHKVWALFPQTNYALSLVYTASAVVLNASQTPLSALPARWAVAQVAPATAFRLLTVTPTAATADEMLRLQASGAAEGPVTVQFNRPGNGHPLVQAPAALRFGEATVPIPTALSCGVWDVRLVEDTNVVPRTSSAKAFLLQPRLRDGAEWRPQTILAPGVSDVANPASAGVKSRSGVIVCGVNPPLAADQEALLQMDPVAGSDLGARPTSAIRLLRAITDGRYTTSLDQGEAPQGLDPILTAAGATGGRTWSVVTVAPGQAWRLTAENEQVRAVFDGAELSFYGGLHATDADDAVAFSVPPLAPADYLIRIRVGGPSGPFSPLRLGARLPFKLSTSAGALLSEGMLPTELTDQLKAHANSGVSIALGPAATVRQPAPNDGWAVIDDYGVARLWIRASDDDLAVFLLDTPDGAYFGPTVTVPPPPGSQT